MQSLRVLFALALFAVPVLGSAAENQRDTWYIGFGFGGGPSPSYSSGGSTHTFDDWFNGTAHGVPSVSNYKVGKTLDERSLLGLDIMAIGQFTDRYTKPKREISVGNMFLMYTYFPERTGFFVRGGGGFASLGMKVGDIRTYVSGYGFGGGIGYAFWLGEKFNLTVNLDHSRQIYSSVVDKSRFTALFVGFDWY